MASNNSNTLLDEKLAVSMFLESLLHEPEEQTNFATPELKPVIGIPTVEITPLEIKPQTKTNETVVVDSTEEVTREIVNEPEVSVESIIPEWAKEPFQVLLFEVAGLKLAVPLIELCGVIEWNNSVTEMPGHADFYLGILQHLDYKIAVIDTARMVLPLKKLKELAGDNPRERVNHIVLIDDYRWGLACDKIGEVITLEPDNVRWRTSKTSRRWLAGTVIEHMCALLNSEGFAKMLETGRDEQNES